MGEMILEAGSVSQVVDIIPNKEVFYLPAHQSIYQAILQLHHRGDARIDLLTVGDELKKAKELKKCGELVYLRTLTDLISSAVHVEAHARLLVEKYLRRRVMEIAYQVRRVAHDESVDVFDALDKAGEELLGALEGFIKKEAIPLGDGVHHYLKTLEERKDTEGVTGVPTGFDKLDKITSGWQPSDLIIVAGRPGMGKTAFCLSMAINIAIQQQRPIAFFSLEMSATQLVFRALSSYAEISSKKLQKGNLSPDEWRRLFSLPDRFMNAPFYLDETPALSMMELRTKARKLRIKHKIELLFVDYLQLMGADINRNHSNREQEIAAISRSLKALAKELNIPIVALSQLSREVEKRGNDKKPILSDLRESGSIEQDADIVIFLYRASEYGISQDESGMPTEGMADILIAKHRNGPTAKVKLSFLGEYMKFDNLPELGNTVTLPSNVNGDKGDPKEGTPF